MPKITIGIDMGHGEISAHYMASNGITPCRLSEDNSERTLISAIGYQEDGTVKISRAALKCKECYSYFKASPAEWDNPQSGAPKDRTRKQLMEDYLRQLMKQIRDQNPELRDAGEDVLLLVGCPASAEWMQESPRKAYEDLISRATGIRVKNVRVVPESRAAIFSVFDLNKDVVIDTTKGVMVFDFGSLTADCTYLLLGRKQEEHSWTLGAGRIEQNLTRIAMAQIDEKRFFSEDIRRMPLWTRGDKEAYFNDGEDRIHSMRLRKCRRNQRTGEEELIPLGTDKYTGKMLYEYETVHVPINSETMGYSVFGKKIPGVSEDMLFCVKKDGRQDTVHASWYDHCRSFFREMKKKVQDQKLPCGTVVLTGGASRMHFVQQLWKETFPEVPASNMIIEKVPAFSVSVGLCYLGNAWMRLDEVSDSVFAGLRQNVKESINRRLDRICAQAAECAYELVYRQFEGVSRFYVASVGTLSRNIQQAFEESTVFGGIIKDGLDEELAEETVQKQQDAVRRVVSQLYPRLEGMIQPMSNREFMKRLKERCADNQMGRSIGDAIGTKVFRVTETITSGIIAMVLLGVLMIILGPIGWIAGSLFGPYLYEKVRELVSEYSRMICSPFTIAIALRSKREEYLKDYMDTIRRCIDSVLQEQECMGKGYEGYLAQVEKESRELVEVISLQKFL